MKDKLKSTLFVLQERAVEVLPREVTVVRIPLGGQGLGGPAEEGELLQEKGGEGMRVLRGSGEGSEGCFLCFFGDAEQQQETTSCSSTEIVHAVLIDCNFFFKKKTLKFS